ncbi:dual specificity protein kinase shkB-like [Triticum aestivum]|uniref:dual specificity protein kinase shkB-like n=1 Tax=Triticum aestivum TaxID=4565 RepID=UPI001D029291|nr:dual specificity protein kinase shkB-like [Triticum aestivum]
MESTPTGNGQRTRHEHRGLRGRLAGIFFSPSPNPECCEQVAKLKEELRKQSDLKETYKARLENAQQYLRFCLEVAQEHGFLHLMSNDEERPPHRSVDEDAEAATATDDEDGDEEPESIEAPPRDPYLAATRDLAVQHGWSVAPDEVTNQQEAEAVRAYRSGFLTACCSWSVKQIELHETIGRGTTAEIHRATWRGLEVAVKWIRPELLRSNPSAEAFFAQELDVLSRQRHPHVLRLMGACLRPPESCFLVTELLSGATLALTGETVLNLSILSGTYVYMAPEVIRCEPYTEKCDVYSFGVMLNELVTGEHPYIDTSYGPSKIALEVADGKLRPRLPEGDADAATGALVDLICRAWYAEPSRRPSFAAITVALRGIQEQLV